MRARTRLRQAVINAEFKAVQTRDWSEFGTQAEEARKLFGDSPLLSQATVKEMMATPDPAGPVTGATSRMENWIKPNYQST